MNTSKTFAVAMILFGGLSLFGQTPAAPQPDKKAAADKPAPPLVRVDLLDKKPVEPGPPKRNIFSPRSGAPAAAVPVMAGVGAAGPAGLSPGALPPTNLGGTIAGTAAPGSAETTAAPAFTIDLRYVGFVDSLRTRKIIGLVVFQGQARAVVEGEVISEGVRIGKISREDIEVIMPDSSTRTFSLEGEDR